MISKKRKESVVIGFLIIIQDEYEKYRILHIGESHFLDRKTYSIEYMHKNWWNNECIEVFEDNKGDLDTRFVLTRYMNDTKSDSYLLFTNIVKSFSKVVLKKPIDHIGPEEKKLHIGACHLE